MTIPYVRVQLFNYDKAPVTLTVETDDDIEYRRLVTAEPIDVPQAHLDDLSKPKNDIEVPAKSVCGFSSRASVKITNASGRNVLMVSANGKDPWPQPPPAAPDDELNSDGNYDKRYANFLMVDATGEEEPQPTVIILVPAGAK